MFTSPKAAIWQQDPAFKQETVIDMFKKLIKSDFTRLFAIGFAGGTALVFATISGEPASTMASGIAPAAVAASAE
jgi:hypothetical protein